MKKLFLATATIAMLASCESSADQFSYGCVVESLKDDQGTVTKVEKDQVVAVWTENQFAQCNIGTDVCTFATFSEVTEKGNILYISTDKITVTSNILALEFGLWGIHTHKNHIKRTILVTGQCAPVARDDVQGILRQLEASQN